ncbi:MAG: hypothetical protein AAFQ82_22595 [Myxococcota bacterium]
MSFGFTSVTLDFHRLGLWLTFLSVAYSMTSAVSYIRLFAKALNEQHHGGAAAG